MSTSFIRFAFAMLFCSLNVSAQAPAGSLRGQVVDQFGGLIVGATVTATDANGAVKTVVTNSEGSFVISTLAVGKSTVKITARGFADYEKEGVVIVAGRATRVDVTLGVTTAKEEVTVGSDRTLSTDPENNKGALVLRGAEIEGLPDDSQEIANMLEALAGPSAGPDGGQIFIDGFSDGRLPPKESIREIRINQNPFSSEFDRLGFGRIEILTKPGTSKLRGQGFFNFNNQLFNSRNPFVATRAPYETRLYGGSISGPIVAKKASFFLDFERRDINDNAIVSATILDSNLRAIPFSDSVIVPRWRTTFSPRLDYELNSKNTIMARYTFFRSTLQNAGVGNFSLLSRAYKSSTTEQTAQLSETAVLSERVINETRFQFIHRHPEQVQANSQPAINVLEAFIGGGAQVGLAFNNENRYELQNYTSVFRGHHTLKFGVRVRGVQITDVSPTNFGGTYTFGGGTAPQLDANNQIVRDANGQPVLQTITSIERYRRTILFQRQGLTPAQVRTFGGGPTQFSINADNPRATVSQIDFGPFIQDDWRPNQELLLSFGMRYENQNNIASNFNFAPRLAFAWAPITGSKRQQNTVVRGGFGVFYDRLAEALTLQAHRFDGFTEQQFLLSNPDIVVPDPANTSCSGLPSLQTLAALSAPQVTIRIAPDLRAPYTTQSAIGVERKLPFGTTVSVMFMNARALHLLRSRNINAPLPGTFVAGAPNSGVRPFGDAGNIYQYESSGRLNQNQLVITATTRLSHNRMSLFGTYVLNKGKSDTDGFITFPVNSYDLSTEYGRAAIDVRHRMIFGGLIRTPWGMSLSPLVTARSGIPFNITTGRDTNGDTRFTERPTFATDFTKAGVIVTRIGAFDPNPTPGQALIPRNFGTGPSFFDIHLRLTRVFGFGEKRGASASAAPPESGRSNTAQRNDRTEGGSRSTAERGGGEGNVFGSEMGGTSTGGVTDKRYNLTVSVLAHNLLNHVNFGPVIGNLSSPLFGTSNTLAGGFGFGSQSGTSAAGGTESGNRRIELQVRVSF
jgi:Carboxypeptidase regulatory-like domain